MLNPDRLLPAPAILFLFLAALIPGPPLAAQAVATRGPAASEDLSRAAAQLQGRVTAGESGVAIEGVTVEILGTDIRTFSDRHGHYRLPRLPFGEVHVRFARLGYSDRTERITLNEREEARLDIGLAVQSIELSALVVLMERTRMVGDPLRIDQIAGSAQLLTRADLEAQPQLFDDVHAMLRRLPGVNVVDEEGYGTRPNIGLRGSGVERSTKVTLMEDGVLIAPAPYAAPAAYYFPTVGRMEAIEVRKGSSQVKYGPRTVGGALNLVSSSIPERPSWHLDVAGGQNATGKVKARAGGRSDHVGWLLETYQLRTDGFKTLQGGGDTGFDLEDYMGKIRFNTDRNDLRYQELEIKVGYTTGTSNETYLGLSEADFRSTPLLRYAGSAADVLDTHHRQLQLRHFLRAGERLDLTTTVYRNEFARNWYKLQSVSGRSLGAVLRSPDAFAAEMEILRGGDSEAGALRVRANNREYHAQGIQTVVGLHFGGRASHDIEIGLRLHQDDEDRFQFEDGYRMERGAMILTSAGTPGSQANRVGEAEAVALYIQDEIRAGAWTFTPGVRWEKIALTRTDFALDDPARSASTGVRETSVTALVPGVGVTFALSPRTHFFGGVHRGFGPPGPGANELTRPEESLNYELGTRLRRSGFSSQVTTFISNYRNILGAATLSSGESGDGDLFNGGAVAARGVEVSLDYDPAWSRSLPVRIPMHMAYTHTRAEFRTAFESDFDSWGAVVPGDRLPYLPENQFSGSIGVEEGGWKVTLGASGSAAMRTTAGRGAMVPELSTDRFVVFNLGGEYTLSGFGTAYMGIQNLADERYVVARRPAGTRPGLPRTLQAGFRMSR